MLARIAFAVVDFAARKGLADRDTQSAAGDDVELSPKERARRIGVRGETYAYWYLRRHGYVMIARNYRVPGTRGEIDLVGYDGKMLAFVEVKTRKPIDVMRNQPTPEDAVNHDKRGHLVRMARQFMRARRVESTSCRFDVLAIETTAGARPTVRLHKGAFTPGN